MYVRPNLLTWQDSLVQTCYTVPWLYAVPRKEPYSSCVDCPGTWFDWGSWLLKNVSAMQGSCTRAIFLTGSFSPSPAWAAQLRFVRKAQRLQDGCAPLPQSPQVSQGLQCYKTRHVLGNCRSLTVVIILTFTRAKFPPSGIRYFYTRSLISTLPRRQRNHEVDVYLGCSFGTISNALLLNFSFEMRRAFYSQINILFHI